MYLVDIRELRARIAEKDLGKRLTSSQYQWLVAEKRLWEEKIDEIKKQGYAL